MMEYLGDRNLDPPDDGPEYSECDWCGNTFCNDDLTIVAGGWYCEECLVFAMAVKDD